MVEFVLAVAVAVAFDFELRAAGHEVGPLGPIQSAKRTRWTGWTGEPKTNFGPSQNRAPQGPLVFGGASPDAVRGTATPKFRFSVS